VLVYNLSKLRWSCCNRLSENWNNCSFVSWEVDLRKRLLFKTRTNGNANKVTHSRSKCRQYFDSYLRCTVFMVLMQFWKIFRRLFFFEKFAWRLQNIHGIDALKNGVFCKISSTRVPYSYGLINKQLAYMSMLFVFWMHFFSYLNLPFRLLLSFILIRCYHLVCVIYYLLN